MTKETETPEKEEGEEEVKEPTAAEIAAAEKLAAAERRAAEAEAETERIRSAKPETKTKTSYSISDWSDAEWASAEAETGKDRKTLLSDINLRAGITAQTQQSLEAMQAQYAVKDELQDALDADPLAPKFKAEAKKFMADIPGDLLKTPEGRKKWISKAIQFAKSGVKLPTGARRADNMDTKDTGGVKDKTADKGFSVEEREVIESHGKKIEDYEAIKHPYMKDGTMHRTKDEAPKFGPR